MALRRWATSNIATWRSISKRSTSGYSRGSAISTTKTYLGPQGNATRRQIIMKHEVEDGRYDPMFVSLRLSREEVFVTPNKWAKYMTPEEQTNHAISEALVNVPILCSLVGREFRNKDVLAAVAAAEKLGELGGCRPAPVAAEGLRELH
jgi:hypothetical protein